jgi:hypothetical protein
MVTVNDPNKRRRTTYWVLGILFAVMAGGALLAFSSAKANRVAEDKAAQLTSAFAAAGLPQPTTEQITRVLGDDGGPMCQDPNNYLHQAVLQYGFNNGATGPGIRPVISDKLVVQGEVLAISIYCPEKLPEFTAYVAKLKFDDVIKE